MEYSPAYRSADGSSETIGKIGSRNPHQMEMVVVVEGQGDGLIIPWFSRELAAHPPGCDRS